MKSVCLNDTRNSLQVSKIAEANFLVFDAAVANLAIGDPMARYARFNAAETARKVLANRARIFAAWQEFYQGTRPGFRTARVSWALPSDG